jgi:hypothetical protein
MIIHEDKLSSNQGSNQGVFWRENVQPGRFSFRVGNPGPKTHISHHGFHGRVFQSGEGNLAKFSHEMNNFVFQKN